MSDNHFQSYVSKEFKDLVWEGAVNLHNDVCFIPSDDVEKGIKKL